MLALGASLLLVSCLSGQLRRRDVILTPPDDSAGLLLAGVGAGFDGGAVFPLSGLDGDLVRLGSVTLAYVFAPGAVFEMTGDALRILEVKLPTSDERRGIGLNTTDFFGNVYGSWGRGPWRVNTELGVGIMEAPLDRAVDWMLDAGLELGYAETSPAWSVELGVARLLEA